MADEIIKVLNELTEKFGLSIDWTDENVVLYIEELCDKFVKYEVATSVVWLILGIIFLFVGIWGIKKTKYCYNRYQENKYSYWDLGTIFVGVVTGNVLLIGIIVIICQVLDIVTCSTFPEKMIIEEIKLIYNSMNN